jgi:signal transduction histidine kinase
MSSVTVRRRLLTASPSRLAAAIVAAFAVATIAIFAAILWRANELIVRQAEAALSAEVAAVGERLQSAGTSGLVALIADRSSRSDGLLFRLETASGALVSGNLAELPAAFSGAAEQRRAAAFTYRRGLGASERLAAGVRLALPDGGRLIVGQDLEAYRGLLHEMVTLLLSAVAGVALLGLGLGYAVNRILRRQVEESVAASKSIMAGRLSERLPVRGDSDEIDRLSLAINAMLDQIERLMTALKDVSDNIAHDLKTPLNRLRSRAESALADPAGDGARKEGLARVIEDADSVIATFDALLLIARVEAGAVAETFSAVDIARIAVDVAELYEPAIEAAGLRLEIAAGAPVHAMANRQLIGQAIANLVDNAVKYSAGASSGQPTPSISISARCVGDMAEITVGDRGPGIEAEDRERVLARFFRLDRSRSVPGTGLGLSLVAAVARLHGGTVRVEDNAPGARFVLSIPSGPSPG